MICHNLLLMCYSKKRAERLSGHESNRRVLMVRDVRWARRSLQSLQEGWLVRIPLFCPSFCDPGCLFSGKAAGHVGRGHAPLNHLDNISSKLVLQYVSTPAFVFFQNLIARLIPSPTNPCLFWLRARQNVGKNTSNMDSLSSSGKAFLTKNSVCAFCQVSFPQESLFFATWYDTIHAYRCVVSFLFFVFRSFSNPFQLISGKINVFSGHCHFNANGPRHSSGGRKPQVVLCRICRCSWGGSGYHAWDQCDDGLWRLFDRHGCWFHPTNQADHGGICYARTPLYARLLASFAHEGSMRRTKIQK